MIDLLQVNKLRTKSKGEQVEALIPEISKTAQLIFFSIFRAKEPYINYIS